MSNVASGLSDRASEASSTASELAGSYSETIAGYAGDAQEAVLERLQRVVAGARSSARTELNFVLEDQPLVLAAIGVAAGAALGAILPGTSAENRVMGETRDKVVDAASDIAKEKLNDLESAASEAGQRLKSAADRAGLNVEGLTSIAKEVAEPFTNLSPSPGTSDHSDRDRASGSAGSSTSGQGTAASVQGPGGRKTS